MRRIIRRRGRLQVGFIVLVIVSCFLLILSAIMRISSIKATCKPVSAKSQNRTEAPELKVVKELQKQIIEESAIVAAGEASSETELLEESDLESAEGSEPVLVAARETEVTEQAESEESLEEPEPRIAEDTPYESTAESTFVADADLKAEPDMMEEPDLEVIEETEAQATEETRAEVLAETEPEETIEVSVLKVAEEPRQEIIEEAATIAAEETSSEPGLIEEPNFEVIEATEAQAIEETNTDVFAEMEPEATLEVSELEVAEEPQPQIIEESETVAAEETFSEPGLIEEPNIEVIEETEAQAIEETDTEIFAETEPEETLEAYELEVTEEPRQEIIEEAATVAAEETSSEPELLEEPNLESVEIPEPVPVATPELEVTEEAESEENLEEPEPWIAEDNRYESTVESTFVVHDNSKAETDMIEEPDLKVIEEMEARAIEETDTEVFAETEPEEALVAYELGAVEEPRQEIVEEQKSMFSYLLQEVFGEHQTADVARPATKSNEASKPKAVVSIVEDETDSVSLRLTNIFSGQAVPPVTQEPQPATTEEVKPDEAPKAPEPQVVEESRPEVGEKKKSIFSFLQGIFK